MGNEAGAGLEKLTKVYLKIKAKRSELSAQFKEDWDSMYKFIDTHNVPEFFEKRLNQTNVKQFLEENPESVPPGLNVDSEYIIAVRKK